MSNEVSLKHIDAAFRDFVEDPQFPCLAGKGVVRASGYTSGVYGELGARDSTEALAAELARFVREAADDEARLHAFVAVFPASQYADEPSFERALWAQLQALSDHDVTSPWDESVSDDASNEGFAFSFAGRALFVVGLHPRSSRLARQFRWPALVFNPHRQFQRLRETGRFERLRAAVREREVALQGSLNPNLADFGEQSEARQYSGRAVEKEWACPFHHRAD
ncbi:MAG: YqcI/YcgG family protein [Gemmatimonadota bacterium]|nr:YqcI/YcgG family protein [Gemmatimonadota bacterium]